MINDIFGKELVNVMDGTIIETESEKRMQRRMQQGQAKMIVEMGQEEGQGISPFRNAYCCA